MFGCEYTSAARWLKYNGVVVILIGLSFYSFKITLIKCVPPVTPVTAVTPVTPRVFISAQCPFLKSGTTLTATTGQLLLKQEKSSNFAA